MASRLAQTRGGSKGQNAEGRCEMQKERRRDAQWEHGLLRASLRNGVGASEHSVGLRSMSGSCYAGRAM
jgi:hypothetical protein